MCVEMLINQRSMSTPSIKDQGRTGIKPPISCILILSGNKNSIFLIINSKPHARIFLLKRFVEAFP